MIKQKKAGVEKDIVLLILALVTLVLILMFVYKLYSKSGKYGDEKACHNSIMLQSMLTEKIPTAKYEKPWPSVCKTKDMVSSSKDPKDAEKELAELMSWCYWMMGEGTLKPFDRDWWSGGRKCFVCYTAQFPKLKQQIDEQEFMFFLQENKRSGMTYYDYMKYGQDKVIGNAITAPLDKQNTYAVVYTSPTDPTFMGPVFGCLAFAGAAALTGVGAPISGAVWAGCSAAAYTAQYLEKAKEDVVYVADINQGEAGCYGSWYASADVHSI